MQTFLPPARSSAERNLRFSVECKSYTVSQGRQLIQLNWHSMLTVFGEGSTFKRQKFGREVAVTATCPFRRQLGTRSAVGPPRRPHWPAIATTANTMTGTAMANVRRIIRNAWVAPEPTGRRSSPECYCRIRFDAGSTSPQNSFGPGRSSLDVQVIRVAAAIMRAIPAMLMTACMAMVLENRDMITKPTNESKT